ncbi:hypothetical protein [Nonomuraea sp. NPDC003754]
MFTVLAALSGMEREYIRDRTLEGRESARSRGKAIGGATVTDPRPCRPWPCACASKASASARSPARLVITQGKKKGWRPSPATVFCATMTSRTRRRHGRER